MAVYPVSTNSFLANLIKKVDTRVENQTEHRPSEKSGKAAVIMDTAVFQLTGKICFDMKQYPLQCKYEYDKVFLL